MRFIRWDKTAHLPTIADQLAALLKSEVSLPSPSISHSTSKYTFYLIT